MSPFLGSLLPPFWLPLGSTLLIPLSLRRSGKCPLREPPGKCCSGPEEHESRSAGKEEGPGTGARAHWQGGGPFQIGGQIRSLSGPDRSCPLNGILVFLLAGGGLWLS